MNFKNFILKIVRVSSEKQNTIYNRIRYFVSLKNGITYIPSHHFAKIKFNSYGCLSIEKSLTLHNVIIHIKSVLNKDKNHYYYKIFLVKCSYQLAKKIITNCFLEYNNVEIWRDKNGKRKVLFCKKNL